MKENDLTQFYKNIEFLMKTQNIKMGDLEKHCNVSAGYISRLKASDGYPSINFLMSLSSLFHVTTDALLEYNFERKTEDEEKVLDLIDKMNVKTNKYSIKWDKLSPNQCLNETDAKYLSSIYSDDELITAYRSLFSDDDYSVNEPFYSFEIDYQRFYIFKLIKKVNYLDEYTDYEMYLYRSKLYKVCKGSSEDEDIFYKSLSTLYLSITLAQKRNLIDEKVKKTIELFLSDGSTKVPVD